MLEFRIQGKAAELPISSHYLYPSHGYVMPPCSAVNIECVAEELKLQHDVHYSIPSLNRAAVLDVQLPGTGPILYHHNREDDDAIPLILETTGGTALSRKVPCAVITRLSTKRVSSLLDVGKSNKNQEQENYSAQSSFKPIPFCEDFPLPDETGLSPSISDYTPDEYEAAMLEVDKYVKYKNGIPFLTP